MGEKNVVGGFQIVLPSYLQGKSVEDAYMIFRRTYLNNPAVSDVPDLDDLKRDVTRLEHEYHHSIERLSVYALPQKNGINAHFWDKNFSLRASGDSYSQSVQYNGTGYSIHFLRDDGFFFDSYATLITDSDDSIVAMLQGDWSLVYGPVDLVNAALASLCEVEEKSYDVPVERLGRKMITKGTSLMCKIR